MRKEKLLELSVKNDFGVRIIPNLILGESSTYTQGDILDANAVADIVNSSSSSTSGPLQEQIDVISGDVNTLKTQINGSGSTEGLDSRVGAIEDLIDADEEGINTAIDKFEEIVDFLVGVDEITLNSILAKFVRSDDVKTIVTLTQAQYDALATKDMNTEYNIIESV